MGKGVEMGGAGFEAACESAPFHAEVCTEVCTPSHESHADSRAARCREGR